jgi:hypothetical protein
MVVVAMEKQEEQLGGSAERGRGGRHKEEASSAPEHRAAGHRITAFVL